MMAELEGYTKEKKVIDLGRANVFAIVILFPILLVFGLPYFLVWGEQFNMDSVKTLFDDISLGYKFIGPLMVFFIILAGIAVHELIHGITWALFTEKGFKSIKFGVFWKMLTPYCHCKEPLKVGQYILGAIMPAIVLGVIPAIAAIAIGHAGLLCFGMFFTMAAGGDFLIINLLRNEHKDDLVLDHPSEAGCFIYRKEV